MFAKAKKKSIIRAAIWAVCLVVLAVVLLAVTGFGIFQFMAGPKDIHDLDAEDMVGQYVEADLNWLVGDYARTTRNGTTISREYVFETDNMVWLGVVCKGNDIKKANALTDDTIAYIEGETNRITKNFTVTGTVKEMDDESKRFFKEALAGSELEGTVTSYYLQIGYIGNVDGVLMWLLTGISGACVLIAIFMLISAAMGRQQKHLLAYCNKTENPEATKERLEQFWQNTPEIGELRMNEEWMMYTINGKQYLLETPHIIWAYQSTTQHRTNGIKTGKSYALTLWDDKGKTMIQLGASEKSVQEMLAYIEEHIPHIVLGYNQELAQLYRADKERFKQLRQPAAAETTASAPVAAVPSAPQTEDTIDRKMFD